jgi:hypothetical protein
MNRLIGTTAALAILGLLVAGCASEEPSSNVDADAVNGSGDIGTFDAGDAATDAEGSAEGGALGDFCDDDDECMDGLECVRPDAEAPVGVCTTACVDDTDCPAEWACFTLADTGEDALRRCLPEDLCIDQDNDQHGWGQGCLGRDCDDSVPTVNASADETCNGVDDDCDTRIDDNTIEDRTECDTGFLGACGPGRLVCTDGSTECVSEVAVSDERCDEVDNDCDGEVDEDDVCVNVCCYDDICEGVCAMGSTGAGGACEAPDSYGDEVCDGLDNDCDGDTDEDGMLFDEDACADTGLFECGAGTSECVEGVPTCVSPGEPETEVCDGDDNDCDGETDEEAVCLGEPCCFRGLCNGVCGDAIQDAAGACVQPSDFGTEVCDGVDNDCDGQLDEGVYEGDPTCCLPCDAGGGRTGYLNPPNVEYRCVDAEVTCVPTRSAVCSPGGGCF